MERTSLPPTSIRERIIADLRAVEPEGLSLTDISGLFSRNVNAAVLRSTLGAMEAHGELTSKRVDTKGRSRTFYYLTTGNAFVDVVDAYLQQSHVESSLWRQDLLFRIYTRAYGDAYAFERMLDGMTVVDSTVTHEARGAMIRLELLRCLDLIDRAQRLRDDIDDREG